MTLLTHHVPQGKIGQTAQRVIPAGISKRGIGELAGLIQFRGNEKDPQVVSASLFAQDPQNSGLTMGPLVALVDWGSGHAGDHKAEVDLPVTNANQVTLEAFGGIGVGQGSGIIISVPCSTLNISARNDGGLIPPIGDLAIGGQNPAMASGLIGVGNRASGSGKLYRTIWQVKGTAGFGLADAGITQILVPSFARSVQVFRGTISAGGVAPGVAPKLIVAQVQAGGAVVDPVAVAANTPCPEIPLSGNTIKIMVQNNDGAGTEILSMFALFTIQL